MRALFLIPGRDELPREQALESLLTGLVRLNLTIMKRREVPPLYKSGVFYCRDRAKWRNALAVIAAGCADCKSLSAYRAAEIIHRGGKARVVVQRTGRNTLHARVLHNGRIEDPSKRLGMGSNR